MPGSLEDALLALERDHDFLIRGMSSPKTLWTPVILQASSRDRRGAPAPHPYEFALYYDV